MLLRILRRARSVVMRGVVTALSAKPSALQWMLRYFTIRKALGLAARLQALRLLGATIGDEVYIGARVSVRRPYNLTVGDGTSLGGTIWIDSWLPVTFGQDVIVSDDALFLTAGHHIDSPVLAPKAAPITIGDHAWLPQRIVVLPGVNIGACAVVGTGSVVTKDVAPYGIVAGNPARVIGERARHPYTYRGSAF
jgi:acetyltransferase-like isoleucine patch superfamily enzyme